MSIDKIAAAIAIAGGLDLALTFLCGLTIGTLMAVDIIPFDGPPKFLWGMLLGSVWLFFLAGSIEVINLISLTTAL